MQPEPKVYMELDATSPTSVVPNRSTPALSAGIAAAASTRAADSTRRRQRVINALERAAACGGVFSVVDIARCAGVHRGFLYRHRDLLERLRALGRGNDAGG